MSRWVEGWVVVVESTPDSAVLVRCLYLMFFASREKRGGVTFRPGTRVEYAERHNKRMEFTGYGFPF